MAVGETCYQIPPPPQIINQGPRQVSVDLENQSGLITRQGERGKMTSRVTRERLIKITAVTG